MNPIPEEWIDKLFLCMTQFFGDRWYDQFKRKNDEKFYKEIWKNGLCGLSYDEIKNTLLKYKKFAENGNCIPPYVTEFFSVARRNTLIYSKEPCNDHKIKTYDVYKKHMYDIRMKLSSNS